MCGWCYTLSEHRLVFLFPTLFGPFITGSKFLVFYPYFPELKQSGLPQRWNHFGDMILHSKNFLIFFIWETGLLFHKDQRQGPSAKLCFYFVSLSCGGNDNMAYHQPKTYDNPYSLARFFVRVCPPANNHEQKGNESFNFISGNYGWIFNISNA